MWQRFKQYWRRFALVMMLLIVLLLVTVIVIGQFVSFAQSRAQLSDNPSFDDWAGHDACTV